MVPLAHTLALLVMTVATMAIKVFPLDMAQDSFDDQYRGCSSAMTTALPALSHSDFQQNPLFARVWPKAVAVCQSQGSPVSPLSSPAQAIAVTAYSSKDVYQQFNAAMHVAGRSPQEYRDYFHYKTFHFLMTQALVTLRDAQNEQCRQAHTCHGVDIQNFSFYRSNREVLIPPYETFEVTEVTQEGNKSQIQLCSTGTFSKYNCEWLQEEICPTAAEQGFRLTGKAWCPGPLAAKMAAFMPASFQVLDVQELEEARSEEMGPTLGRDFPMKGENLDMGVILDRRVELVAGKGPDAKVGNKKVGTFPGAPHTLEVILLATVVIAVVTGTLCKDTKITVVNLVVDRAKGLVNKELIGETISFQKCSSLTWTAAQSRENGRGGLGGLGDLIALGVLVALFRISGYLVYARGFVGSHFSHYPEGQEFKLSGQTMRFCDKLDVCGDIKTHFKDIDNDFS
ncbi:hypothetical protein HGM15179_013014 [Zosterops borbonicus]|uniref:NAD(P)(+)--arginine ADP-ribosyltransferase n=1 Tax=Zosterops borbonicus TaxID=364589 RepID=A0A8K1G9L1_9PASS|nr:hypothetical protein HGM15179_013014 [Zosterops borbonicus]